MPTRRARLLPSWSSPLLHMWPRPAHHSVQCTARSARTQRAPGCPHVCRPGRRRGPLCSQHCVGQDVLGAVRGRPAAQHWRQPARRAQRGSQGGQAQLGVYWFGRMLVSCPGQHARRAQRGGQGGQVQLGVYWLVCVLALRPAPCTTRSAWRLRWAGPLWLVLVCVVCRHSARHSLHAARCVWRPRWVRAIHCPACCAAPEGRSVAERSSQSTMQQA